MKRFWKMVIGIGSAFAVMAISAGASAATQNQTVSGTTNSSIYKVGQTVTITGIVNGDIYCAGQTIDIDAIVNGDVLCAGQTVTVDGQVNGNVRVAGQTVNIGAKVAHSATITAQDTTFQSNAKVGIDLSIAAQTANIDGQIGRDLHGATNTLFLNNSIGRNVEATTNKLELSSNAHIGDNLTYTSPSKLQQASGASIGGKVTYHVTSSKNHSHPNWAHVWFIWNLYMLAALLLFAMVLVALFPQTIKRYNDLESARPWATLLTGFIAMIIVPTLIAVVAFTIIGIPLAIFMGVIWLLFLALSLPLSAYYIGRLILKHEKRAPLIMLLGIIVLDILWLIPVVGVIVSLLASWFGTGSLLLNLKQTYKKPIYDA